jgi:hypothetical protein
MQNHIPKIRALHRAIESNLFHRNPEPRLSYYRLTHAIDLLSRIVHDYPGESDCIWSIGEAGSCTVDSLIVGAYWHFTEWHAGQNSDGYRALSNLGSVFSPGRTSGPEPDTTEDDVYRALDAIARKSYGMPVYRFASIWA